MNHVPLSTVPLNTPARIAEIMWAHVTEAEAHRLREFGFAVGADVEPLHYAGFWARDPIAVRVGRMTVALRRKVASAIMVTVQ